MRLMLVLTHLIASSALLAGTAKADDGAFPVPDISSAAIAKEIADSRVPEKEKERASSILKNTLALFGRVKALGAKPSAADIFKVLGVDPKQPKTFENFLEDLGLPTLEPTVVIRSQVNFMRIQAHPMPERALTEARLRGLVQLTTSYAYLDNQTKTMSVVFSKPADIKFEFVQTRPSLDINRIGLYEYTEGKLIRIADEKITISSDTFVTLTGTFLRAGIFAPFAQFPEPKHPAGYRMTKTIKVVFPKATYLHDSERDAYILKDSFRNVIVDVVGEEPITSLSATRDARTDRLKPGDAVVVSFRRAADGEVIRSKLQPGNTVPVEVPVRFTDGSWEKYLAGETVDLEVTEEGYDSLSRLNAANMKTAGAEADTGLAATFWFYGYRLSAPTYSEPLWPKKSRLRMNKTKYTETEQLMVMPVTFWVNPREM